MRKTNIEAHFPEDINWIGLEEAKGLAKLVQVWSIEVESGGEISSRVRLYGDPGDDSDYTFSIQKMILDSRDPPEYEISITNRDEVNFIGPTNYGNDSLKDIFDYCARTYTEIQLGEIRKELSSSE